MQLKEVDRMKRQTYECSKCKAPVKIKSEPDGVILCNKCRKGEKK